MPQAWGKHWPLEEGADLTAALHRARIVQTVGNLTLITQSLNSDASNEPWDRKREKLDPHTVLQLNRTLLKHAGPYRDEDRIRLRGLKLADLACKVWPRPS